MDGEVGPEVVFDFPGVLQLCKQANDLADALEQFQATRTDALNTALGLWRGPEAEKMVNEIAPAEQTNVLTGAEALRSGAEQWATSWKDAQQQYNNREYAKAVKYEQDDRSGLEKFGDAIMGQDNSAERMPEAPTSAAPVAPDYAPPSTFVSYKKSGDTWTMYEWNDVPTGAHGASAEPGQAA